MEHYPSDNRFRRQLKAVFFFVKHRALHYAAIVSAGAMVWGSVVMPAAAASPTLFGSAVLLNSGHSSSHAVQLSSSKKSPGYGGVDFSVPSDMTFTDVQQLRLDYNVTDDDCRAGSPRFQINVDTGKGIRNIFVHIGPEPKYSGCAQNTWVHTMNLLGSGTYVDTTELRDGVFRDSYAAAVSKYGSYPVLGIQLIVDSGDAFPDNEETVIVDNVFVNNNAYTFESSLTSGYDLHN